MMPSFLADYARILAAAIPAEYTDTHGADRFGPLRAKWHNITRGIRRWLVKFGFIRVKTAKRTVIPGIQFVTPHLTELEWLYAHLAEEESQQILVKVIAFLALGNRKIKLDIEGAELAALRGAEKTLRRFHPKLPFCGYHNLPDFWEIPQHLDTLKLGSKSHLWHFTIHQEETVLSAAVR